MQRLNKSSQPGRIDARREFWSIWISLPAGEDGREGGQKEDKKQDGRREGNKETQEG